MQGARLLFGNDEVDEDMENTWNEPTGGDEDDRNVADDELEGDETTKDQIRNTNLITTGTQL